MKINKPRFCTVCNSSKVSLVIENGFVIIICSNCGYLNKRKISDIK